MSHTQYENRVACLRSILSKKRIDAMLVTSPYNRRYLTGFTAEDNGCDESSGAVLITKQESFLLTDGRYKTQAENEAGFCDIKIYKKGLSEVLKKVATKIELKKIIYEPSYFTCTRFEALQDALSEVEFVDNSNEIELMRSVKEGAELDAIAKAQAVAEQVFERAFVSIKPGMTEKQVAWKILEGTFKLADSPSFPPIVASGENSALPHATPTDKVLQECEPIVIDMGVRVNGYCSDMTRTIFLGEPSAQMKEIYMVVRRAQLAAQNSIRSGMNGKAADQIARQIICDAGYGKYFMHSLGHGVGLAIHEHPRLSPKAGKITLKKGMVVTVEPGIYIAGVGGVRLENMGVVEEKGLRIFTSNKWFYNF